MNRTITSSVFALMLLFSAAASHAGPIGITLATIPLVGNPGSPFSLDFQFTDGSGTSDGNNTLTLTNFNFGGGSAGVPILIGAASGTVAGGFTLHDSSFFNDVTLPFTPGSTLSFTVTTTANVDAGGTPDLFTFGILDRNGFNIPTTAGSFFDVFVEISLDSTSPPVLTFASDTSRPLSTGDATPRLSAPIATPEPGGLLLLLGGAMALAGLRRWKG